MLLTSLSLCLWVGGGEGCVHVFVLVYVDLPTWHIIRSSCCSAVLDEVDILFNDEDFEAALQSLINSSPVTTQYLFVTATLPLGIYNKLVEDFPDCQVVMAPGMHRISPGLEEVGLLRLWILNCSLGN